jgi:hypothetical protein
MVLPYLKGFDYFLCSLLMNGLVDSWLFLKYICRSIEVLKNCYQNHGSESHGVTSISRLL